MPRILFFLALLQDLDLLLPIAAAARERRDISPTLCITRQLLKQFPWLRARLGATGIRFKTVENRGVLWGLQPRLSGISALLTASESTAPPHAAGLALTRRANRRGLRTYTLQHGLENVGLTYFGADAEDVTFASATIFTWHRPDELPAEVPDETRHRCVGVGRPVSPEASHSLPALPADSGQRVLICENLHWERYGDAFRRRFLDDLANAAATATDWTFIIRSHPAGRWLFHNLPDSLAIGNNVVVIAPDDPDWRQVSTADLVSGVTAVITTPSTIALDAAFHKTPVAVAGYGLNLTAYAPLPVLTDTGDWNRFLSDPDFGATDPGERLRTFVDRIVLAGDAGIRILDVLAGDLQDL